MWLTRRASRRNVTVDVVLVAQRQQRVLGDRVIDKMDRHGRTISRPFKRPR